MLAFPARIAQDTGSATVTDEGAAYLANKNKKPEVYTPDKPVTYSNLSVCRVPAAEKLNVQTWTGQGGESNRFSARAGILFSPKKTDLSPKHFSYQADKPLRRRENRREEFLWVSDR